MMDIVSHPNGVVVNNKHYPALIERILKQPIIVSEDTVPHHCVRITTSGLFTSYGSGYTTAQWDRFSMLKWWWKAINTLISQAIPERVRFAIDLAQDKISKRDCRRNWIYWGKGEVIKWFLFNLFLIAGVPKKW
jgi:hypothetical protein